MSVVEVVGAVAAAVGLVVVWVVLALALTVLSYRFDGIDLLAAVRRGRRRSTGKGTGGEPDDQLAPTSFGEGEWVTKRQGEYEGPKDDDLHFADGSHRTQPPPNVNEAAWRRRRRLHLEGHGTDEFVRRIAPDLFGPEPKPRPRRP